MSKESNHGRILMNQTLMISSASPLKSCREQNSKKKNICRRIREITRFVCIDSWLLHVEIFDIDDCRSGFGEEDDFLFFFKELAAG